MTEAIDEIIEPAVADPVGAATQTLTLATSEAQTADAALAAAHAVLLTARQAFLATPIAELEAEIDAAAKVVARCELYSEARTFGVRTAENLADAASRLAAEQELDKAGDARELLRRDLKIKLEELRELSNRAGAVVAELEALVDNDQRICALASDAQKRAKVPGSICAIELDTLLRATQIMLAAGRPRPRSTTTTDAGMDSVLTDLARQTSTADERACVLELALLAHARVGGASTGMWLTAAHPLPTFLNTTASASAYAQGARLLAALQGDQK